MRQCKEMIFLNGDIWDIGQTVNGISKFIVIENKWHYFSNRLMREYEYDQDSLDHLIYEDKINGGLECNFMGNIFNYIGD